MFFSSGVDHFFLCAASLLLQLTDTMSTKSLAFDEDQDARAVATPIHDSFSDFSVLSSLAPLFSLSSTSSSSGDEQEHDLSIRKPARRSSSSVSTREDSRKPDLAGATISLNFKSRTAQPPPTSALEVSNDVVDGRSTNVAISQDRFIPNRKTEKRISRMGDPVTVSSEEVMVASGVVQSSRVVPKTGSRPGNDAVEPRPGIPSRLTPAVASGRIKQPSMVDDGATSRAISRPNIQDLRRSTKTKDSSAVVPASVRSTKKEVVVPSAKANKQSAENVLVSSLVPRKSSEEHSSNAGAIDGKPAAAEKNHDPRPIRILSEEILVSRRADDVPKKAHPTPMEALPGRGAGAEKQGGPTARAQQKGPRESAPRVSVAPPRLEFTIDPLRAAAGAYNPRTAAVEIWRGGSGAAPDLDEDLADRLQAAIDLEDGGESTATPPPAVVGKLCTSAQSVAIFFKNPFFPPVYFWGVRDEGRRAIYLGRGIVWVGCV